MSTDLERVSGVGEDETPEKVPSELLDYLAREGLRKILLITSTLRKIAGEQPTTYPDLPAKVHELEQLSAWVELGLKEAGYNDEVQRLPSSLIRPAPHDAATPRTNT